MYTTSPPSIAARCVVRPYSRLNATRCGDAMRRTSRWSVACAASSKMREPRWYWLLLSRNVNRSSDRRSQQAEHGGLVDPGGFGQLVEIGGTVAELHQQVQGAGDTLTHPFTPLSRGRSRRRCARCRPVRFGASSVVQQFGGRRGRRVRCHRQGGGGADVPAAEAPRLILAAHHTAEISGGEGIARADGFDDVDAERGNRPTLRPLRVDGQRPVRSVLDDDGGRGGRSSRNSCGSAVPRTRRASSAPTRTRSARFASSTTIRGSPSGHSCSRQLTSKLTTPEIPGRSRSSLRISARHESDRAGVIPLLWTTARPNRSATAGVSRNPGSMADAAGPAREYRLSVPRLAVLVEGGGFRVVPGGPVGIDLDRADVDTPRLQFGADEGAELVVAEPSDPGGGNPARRVRRRRSPRRRPGGVSSPGPPGPSPHRGTRHRTRGWGSIPALVTSTTARTGTGVAFREPSPRRCMPHRTVDDDPGQC